MIDASALARSSTSSSVDVLVIGSGLVGATFARLITENRPNTSIMMVELGPQLTIPPGLNVANLTSDDRARAQAQSQGPERDQIGSIGRYNADHPVRALPGLHLAGAGGMPAAAMASCVGGMGAHWSCATPRPCDSERISFIGDSEWEDAITTAEALLCTTQDMFSESVGGRAIRSVLADLFRPMLPSDKDVGVQPMAARPLADGEIQWTGVDTILGPLAQKPSRDGHLELRSETICRSLAVVGDRVTGARLEHLPTKHREYISAEAVVVTADSLRTPQVLWASGIRPNALGRYLAEHSMACAAIELDAKLVPALTNDEARRGVVSVSRVPFADPGHPFNAQILQTSGRTGLLGSASHAENHSGYALLSWMARKWPRPEDRVLFSEERTDWCGMPAMTIEYELTNAERAEAACGLRLLERASTALGRYVSGAEARLMPTGTSLHYQGTVRMGERNDGTSVCDSQSRVWGFRNLFVGGNGVIPTATACNPTLTSVALAARSSNAVLEVLK